VNGKQVRIWKETAMACLRITSLRSLGKADERNYDKNRNNRWRGRKLNRLVGNTKLKRWCDANTKFYEYPSVGPNVITDRDIHVLA
jgi:hypothetical protein